MLYLIMNGFASANIHITNSCNYCCSFCFSGSGCSSGKQLTADQWGHRLEDLVRNRRISKINYAGGEPLLYPYLEECLDVSKEYGAVNGIVSNGSLIDSDFFSRTAGSLDWIGLSIDSVREDIEMALGRHCRGIIHLDHVLEVAALAKSYGIKVKLNITVTRFCLGERFGDFIDLMEPDRVKFFQVSEVNNVNNAAYSLLSVTPGEFDAFRRLNSDIVLSNGDIPCFETSDDMFNSYLMLDCAGNIRVNSSEGYVYVDYDTFWEQGSDRYLDAEKYIGRGGIYDWGNGIIEG